MDGSALPAKSWYNNDRKHHYNMEESKMITAEFTQDEVSR